MERSFPMEKFKAALRVANRHFNQSMQKIEETPRSQAPIPRLIALNFGLLQTSRTGHDRVTLIEPMCHLIVLIQRYLVVSVRITDNAPTCEPDGLSDASTFPAAFLMSDDCEVRIFTRDLADQFASAIVAVCGNDNFCLKTATSKIAKGCFNCSSD